MRRCSALAVFLLLGACANARTVTNVGMQKDQADIVFGFDVRAHQTAAATPQVPSAAAQSAGDAIAAPTPMPFLTSLFASEAPSGPCPSAPPNAPVSEASTTEVQGRPQPGKYRWVQSGTYELAGTKIPTTPYTDVYVTPPQKYTAPVQGTPDDFMYATITPEISSNGSYRRYSWATKPDPQSSQDAEGGLVLKRVDFLGSDGKPGQSYFAASGNGLLMAPFPIQPGNSWNSLSIDTSKQKILSLSGQVVARDVIDACGTLVQGWHVHATLNDSGSMATLDYLVAPQYGGVLISLRADGTFIGTVEHNLAGHTGQLRPDPLPDEFK
jgi:hypothetical protein